MSLDVYTASAGSGKTHTLTREYLRLALSTDDPNTYKYIQAVTFTNKATAEMKERITKELYQLASNPATSPFYTELEQRLRVDGATLQLRAQSALRALLLDYASFRVRTIDSFFQEVIRSFAYELGVSSSLRIQLDGDTLRHRAVLEVLADQDGTAPDKALQSWLKILAEEEMESGKSYHIERRLETFAAQLEVEPVKLLRQQMGLPNKDQIADLQKKLKKRITRVRQKALLLIQKALETLEATSIPEDKLKTPYPFGALKKCQANAGDIFDSKEKIFYSQNKTLTKVIQSEDEESALGLFLAKKDKTGENKLELYGHQLRPHIGKILKAVRAFGQLCEKRGRRYITDVVIYEYLGRYGLLIDIDKKLQELKQEQGSMLLADAPTLISNLLNGSETEAPFLYEKIGAKIRHHMIDEFQDTSRLQYDNFLPLLHDSIASGNDSLVVGDAKQSIYRFRNSDSSLLTSSIPEDFADSVRQTSLQENWRSTPEVITFNNDLYRRLCSLIESYFAQLIEGAYPDSTTDEHEHLQQILEQHLSAYADVEQKVPEQKKTTQGLVVLHEYKQKSRKGGSKGQADDQATETDETGDTDEESQTKALEQLPYALIDLQKRGYRPKDIAILVRKNTTAVAVADVLQSFPMEEREGYSLSFISQEALLVSSVPSTRFIIAALSYISSDGGGLELAILNELYAQLTKNQGNKPEPPLPTISEETLAGLKTIGRRGLYEAGEAIIHLFQPILPDEESAYIVHLLNMLYSWEAEQSADISSFLEHWEEKGKTEKIVTPSNEQACTLMTIHKSKGLGFPVVLLPDLEWDLDETNNTHENILWCSTEKKELRGLPLEGIGKVPIKYTSKLYHSHFAPEYLQEQMGYAFDALNLLYVATTRAKEELHIWINSLTHGLGTWIEPKEKNGKMVAEKKEVTKLSTVNQLFTSQIEGEKELWRELPARIIPPEESSPESYPRLLQHLGQAKEQTEEILPITSISSYPVTDRIAILRRGLDYFSEEKQLRYGHTMHLILAEIATKEDIEGALKSAVNEGLVAPEESETLKQSLHRIVEAPECARWFDGSGQVRNESPIIGGGLEGSRRPDRIIFYDEAGERSETRVEVIDYKFGHYNKHYFAQVRGYMSLLQRMGYQEVKGWLCYISEDDKIKVIPVSSKDTH